MELEDEADFLIPELGKRLLGEDVFCISEQKLLIKEYLSTVMGVDGAEQVQ